jgi:predicted nucleic acid-binding protein
VDTNILNGAYLGRKTDMDCLRYLYSLQGKRLYISALTIGQFVAFFQNRKWTNEKIKNTVKYIATKFNIVEFNSMDLEYSLSLPYSDMEDAIQFAISAKVKCYYFVTNDKGFSEILDVDVLKSKEIRAIRK